MKSERLRHCPVCGKEYNIPDAEVWVYRKHRKNAGDIYFCSWGCMRLYEENNKPKSEQIRDAIRAGLAPAEICTRFCISKQQYEYHKERIGSADGKL